MNTDEDYDRVLHTEMARLAKGVVLKDVAVEEILSGVTLAAVNLIDGVECADVLLLDNGDFRSMAPTAELACKLDAAQHRLQRGPCLAAAVADSAVRCTDLRDEVRWPEFAATAVRLGVYSMLCFQLNTAGARSAALNLFGYAPHDFSIGAQAVGAMLATQAAMAFAMGDKQDQFHSALASRDAIGQAKGIVMERFQVDAVQAFDLLRRLSQSINTPLRDVAASLISSLDT
jgi:hypothetical protein